MEADDYYSVERFLWYRAVYLVIAGVGILGNAFNLSILYSSDLRDNKLLRRGGVMFALLKSLAISDILFLVCSLQVFAFKGRKSINSRYQKFAP